MYYSQMKERSKNNPRRRYLFGFTAKSTTVVVGAAISLWVFVAISIWIRLPDIDETSTRPALLRSHPVGGVLNPPGRREVLDHRTIARKRSNDTTVVIDLDHPPKFRSNEKQQSSSSISTDVSIVHSIFTRFMVGQPNQPVLARARLELFKTFCYPTIVGQTNQNFYWLVVADPRIDRPVLQELKFLLEQMTSNNAYLILTTNTTLVADGLGVPNVTNYGMGIIDIVVASSTTNEQRSQSNYEIVTGNQTRLYNLRKDLQQQQQTLNTTATTTTNGKIIIIIETLLDADDGLHNQAIEWFQQEAYNDYIHLSTTKTTTASTSRRVFNLESTWKIICATNQIEWHNRDVFMLTQTKYKHFGISSGITGLRELPTFCPSAGYTRLGIVSLFGIDHPVDYKSPSLLLSSSLHFPQQAYVNHGTVHIKFPSCSENMMTTERYRCWKRDTFPTVALVVKTRTITSDSMDNLNPEAHGSDYKDVEWTQDDPHPLWINETEKTWDILQSQFAISRYQSWITSMYLYEHAEQILSENNAARW